MNHIHIVGGGIAGALLSLELRKLGVAVSLEDAADPESSSRVAAGMITPITGKRLKSTWRGAELTNYARDVYAEVGLQLGVPLIREWTLRRVFREEIQMTWFRKRRDAFEYQPLEVSEIPPGTHAGVEYPFGGLEHNSVYTVDIPALLRCTDALPHSSAGADITVWCTGYHVMRDPLWSWLPLEPSKGEILDVRIESLQLDHVLSNGTWILPVGNDFYRIGATHHWDDIDPNPTEEARSFLLAEASKLVGERAIEVVGHRAAIRPSTQFKRPLAGIHPEHTQHAVFTGLGTKGALQGPWAAKQLAHHLVMGEPLDQEIDIMRWWKK